MPLTTNPVLESKLQELLALTSERSPKALLEQVEEFREEKGIPKSERISLRTIERRVRAAAASDQSERWRLAPAAAADPSATLEVLAAVTIHTKGAICSLTVTEARWIASIRAAAPDISPWECFALARTFIARTFAEAPVDDLEAYLAFSPWSHRGDEERNEERRRAYYWAVYNKQISPVPWFIGPPSDADANLFEGGGIPTEFPVSEEARRAFANIPFRYRTYILERLATESAEAYVDSLPERDFPADTLEDPE